MARLLIRHLRGGELVAALGRVQCIPADKRGGGGRRVELDVNDLAAAPPADALEALDEALSRLAAEHPQQAELVQLRYFGGLTLEQCADVLGASARTADTWWAYARAWLAVALSNP